MAEITLQDAMKRGQTGNYNMRRYRINEHGRMEKDWRGIDAPGWFKTKQEAWDDHYKRTGTASPAPSAPEPEEESTSEEVSPEAEDAEGSEESEGEPEGEPEGSKDAEGSTSAEPVDLGGGWYLMPNGDKVHGRTAAGLED